VPLDYRAPRGRTIEITISRIATAQPGTRRGILPSNPGGPGHQGIDLPSALAYLLAVFNCRFARKRQNLARQRQRLITSVLRFTGEDLTLGGIILGRTRTVADGSATGSPRSAGN
jgi:hypothetical protein